MALLNDSREYPQRPVVAVGGAIIENRKVLLIRRAKEPRMGEWSIPGGAVETGETLRDALRREIREETGLAVRVGEILEVFDRILPDSQGRVQYHYVLVDFVCSAEGGELKAASDVSEACWAGRQELGRFELRPDTLRVIEKAFQCMEVQRQSEKK